MRKVLDNLDAQEVAKHQKKLAALGEHFAAIAAEHGFAGENCHQVCRDEIVIGSNGQPHHEVVCRLICTS